MRRPRLRFTVRRLMVAVAAIGGASGAYLGIMTEGRLAQAYRRRAAEHRMWEEVHRQSGERFRMLWLEAVESKDPEHEDFRSTAEWDEARRRWHGELMRKYEYAASRPWLPVEPDPPEPK
jgi:hypothetical protein